MSTILTWYGHSTLGLETAGYKLVIDPFFNNNPKSPLKADQVEADYILVTHGHGDHLGDTLSIARRTKAKVITGHEIALWLGKQGVEVHGQASGGGFQHPFGYLKLVHAQHGSALPDGSYGGVATGFLLTVEGNQKIYFAGDTGLFGDMRLIGEEGISLACLPVGDNYTMGPDDALRAVKLLQPKHVIPVHYGTFGVIQQDIHIWAERVEAETNTKVHVLQPGQTYTL